MAKYRKKPVVIDAVQWDGDPETLRLLPYSQPAECRIVPIKGSQALSIQTLEGTMRCEVGDWIIKGVKGELYPCKPDIFAATYEPAHDPRKEGV